MDAKAIIRLHLLHLIRRYYEADNHNRVVKDLIQIRSVFKGSHSQHKVRSSTDFKETFFWCQRDFSSLILDICLTQVESEMAESNSLN